MIILRERDFSSKATKAQRRKELIEAAEHSFEKDQADRLLKEGKITQREWEQAVFKKGRERLGISKPVLSDGGFTINLENIPEEQAGLVNRNYKNKYSKAGKSKIERNALKATTKRQLGEYAQGGVFGPSKNGEVMSELIDNAFKEGKISGKGKKELMDLVERGKDAQYGKLRKLEKSEKFWKAAANVEKKAKKAAPYVLAGTALAGATAAGIKVAKKNKAEKEKSEK